MCKIFHIFQMREVRDGIHRTDEHCHRDILTHGKDRIIDEIIDEYRDDRPSELENRRDVYGSRLQSSIVDIHSDESSRTGDREEIEPLRLCREPESSSPVGDQEESDSDNHGSEGKSEHRDDFWVMVSEEILREIGRYSPGSSGTESVEGCEDFLLSVWCRRDSMRKGDEISRDEGERDKEIGEWWDSFLPDNHRSTYRENWLELLDEDRDGEGDESNRSECHSEEKCPDHSWEERDREYRTFLSRSEGHILPGSIGKREDQEKSENMLEKNEGRWRKSVEWTSEESVDSPESSCDNDEERSEIHEKILSY